MASGKMRRSARLKEAFQFEGEETDLLISGSGSFLPATSG